MDRLRSNGGWTDSGVVVVDRLRSNGGWTDSGVVVGGQTQE